jgi:hypothetical protein
MKIGILTFHNIPNIGAMLQAYALTQVIRKMGHQCELIDYACENIVKRETTFQSTHNALKDFILKRLVWPKQLRKIKNCAAWMSATGLVGRKHFNRANISESLADYDAFLTGSDMVWNLDITRHDYTFMQDFVTPDKKQMAYASSIGGTWDEADVEKIKQLLSRYKAIAVRESDTAKIINNLGLKCRTVADPTLLLTPHDWAELGRTVEQQYTDYVLVYFPSKHLLDKAKQYAKPRGLKVIAINSGLHIFGVINAEPQNPAEWISLFQNAAAVFSNSYHGLLFGLQFCKPLWTANYGNRLTSMLSYLNQPGIMIENDVDLQHKIDYSHCTQRIEQLRTESLNYLKEALS